MTINISVPASWSQLSQEQLRFLLATIVSVNKANRNVRYRSQEDFATQQAAQVNTICFLEWSGLSVICQYDDGWLVSFGETEFQLSAETVASAISALDWTRGLPEIPVRLDSIDGAKAIESDISSSMTFDSWLACEALWQQYQSTQEDETLRLMAEILYNKDGIRLDQVETLSIFYWWAAVKEMVSNMFPHFFKGVVTDTEQSQFSYDDVRRNVDAQIRALTKGDITKEKDILAMNAIRALTELDAQAREYDELQRKYPTK